MMTCGSHVIHCIDYRLFHLSQSEAEADPLFKQKTTPLDPLWEGRYTLGPLRTEKTDSLEDDSGEGTVHLRKQEQRGPGKA
jgi:hypothetical protein